LKADLLLDTCAVIWAAGSDEPGKQLDSILNAAFDAQETVWVSPITAWELGNLTRKGRQATTTPPLRWYQETCARAGLEETVLDARILVASTELPGEIHRDPADRILIATARELGLQIVTRDRLILAYADKGHVLAVAC
jgi:PIN domain nuclease of toxin-antitoxin system